MSYSSYKYKKTINNNLEHELYIREYDNGLLLKFSITEFTDDNIWRMPHIICNKRNIIVTITKETINKFNFSNQQIIGKFKNEFFNNNWIGNNIEHIATTYDKIDINLRTNYYKTNKPINTLWPVKVTINNEDYSKLFMDCDIFKFKQVETVEKMILGKFDESEIKNNMFFNKNGLNLLKKLGLNKKIEKTLKNKHIYNLFP